MAVALLHEPELLILDEPTVRSGDNYRMAKYTDLICYHSTFQVGVDPLLRTSIWDHLTEMSGFSIDGSRSNRNSNISDGSGKSSNAPWGCTIVITTHYIEEARQANRVSG